MVWHSNTVKMTNSFASESLLTKSLLDSHAALHFGILPESPLREMATKVDNGDVVCTIKPIDNGSNHSSTFSSIVPEMIVSADASTTSRGSFVATRRRGDSLPIAIPGRSAANHAVDSIEAFPHLKLEGLPEALIEILGTAPKKEQRWSFSSIKSQVIESYKPASKALDIQKNNFFPKFIKPSSELHAEDGRLIFNQYPPLPNDLFELSSDLKGAFMGHRHKPSLDGKLIVDKWIAKEKNLLKLEAQANAKRVEAMELAETYNFNKICYSGGVAGHDNKAQFIEDYVSDGLVYSHCKVCGDDHIPYGAPIDLPERDPCCAMLPEWWPRDMGFPSKGPGGTKHISQPWKAWNLIWKEYCFQDDFAKGYKDHIHGEPDLPRQWDMHWHEGREWDAIGRKQGWWKCRTKENGGSILEDRCRFCHVEPDEILPEINGYKKGTKEYAVLRRDEIGRWINELVAQGGKKDRAWVLTNINENRQVMPGMTGFDF